MDDNKEIINQQYEGFLHQLAANPTPDSSAKGYIRVIENYLDESDSHEINERDSHGCTALHLAVKNYNVDAVVGLLMCGADVNVCDYENKSPFTYLLDKFQRSSYKGNLLFFTLHGHVHKLLALGLEVGTENRRCYGIARAMHAFNDKQLQIGYALELDKMQDVQITRGTTLRDVLYGGARMLANSTLKRKNLEDILTSSDFSLEFPKLCCVITMQYRKGMTRKRMIEPAKKSLEDFVPNLPDPCSENIILFLDDEDLINLINARIVD